MRVRLARVGFHTGIVCSFSRPSVSRSMTFLVLLVMTSMQLFMLEHKFYFMKISETSAMPTKR